MSFNAKNLSYEKNEPSFLKRLRGANETANDGRQNVQIARPKKDRLKTGDGDEDEPVIVDENGEVVSKDDFEKLSKPQGDESVAADASGARPVSGDVAGSGDGSTAWRHDGNGDGAEKQATVASIGGARKRKQARAIGGDEEADLAASSLSSPPLAGPGVVPQARTTINATIPTADSASKTKSTETISKSGTGRKRGGKKIKLSFDDPD